MAVTRYTLTGDFGDIVGDEFNVKSVKAFLSTNLPAGQALVNLTDNEIQVGAKELTLDTSGAFSVSLIASDSADTNIASGTLQYRVTFSYVNPSTRTRDTWDSGYFALTANSDLSDVAGTIEAPISWRSAFIADMEAIQAAAEAARDAAVDISSISTSDDVVEALVLGTAGAGPKTRAALSASYAGIASATLAAQPFLKKIKRAVEDPVLLFIGDSTMNDGPDWAHKLVETIAPDWPTHTFDTYIWNDTTHAYDAFDTVQTGTGARTVNVYLGCVPGWKFTDVLAPDFDTLVKAVDADLIVIGLGHNEALVTNDFRNRYVTGVESLTAAHPAAEIICVAPNPRAVGDDQMAYKAQQIERICAQRGYGFVDAHQMFKDLGDYSGYMLDAIHPNPAGSLLTAALVARHFAYQPGAGPSGRSASTLLTPTEQLLSNGDFASVDGSNVPTDWTATDLTITLDTADFENPSGRSLLLTDAGAASVSHIQQALPAELVAGQWVTLAARVKIASDQGASAGNIALGDSSGITTSLGESTDKGKGGWRWETISRYFPVGVTAPYARLYADSSSVNSWAVRVDRAVCARGLWPRDLAFGSGQPGPAGEQGPAGTGAFARKTADTARTSNLLTDDPHLTVAVEANATYELEAILFVNSASDTPDLKVAFTWPGDAVGIYGQDGLSPSGASTAGSISRAVSVASGTNPGSLMATSSKTMVRVRGILRTVTAGNLTLQWAQAVTDATATTVYADSFLVARKVT